LTVVDADQCRHVTNQPLQQPFGNSASVHLRSDGGGATSTGGMSASAR
jgi:hypothetical protein